MVSAPTVLTLRNTSVMDRTGRFDVTMRDGLVAGVEPTAGPTDVEGTVIDAGGRVCIGAFVDSHCHLDKAFLSEETDIVGTVADGFFERLRERKARADPAEARARMERALEQAVFNGTGTMRAQIDVDDVVGLTYFDVAVALRDEWSDRIRLQLVVFPQEGLAANPAARDVVTAALANGADVMGGAHGFDPGSTNTEHLEACFELAALHDIDLDLHIDFTATPDTPWPEWDLFHVARLSHEYGLAGRVAVAHVTQHGQLAPTKRTEMVALLTDAGISLTVVPGAELHTARAWADGSPATSPVEATADWPDLIEAGVALSYGGGHLADPFHPHGEGDLLRDGLLLCSARNLGDPCINGTHVLTMATDHPAKAVGLGDRYGVMVGAPADLVVLDAENGDQAVRRQADRWLVVHGGRPVARSKTESEFL